jgi:undecaprenyl-diphosphatase
MEVMELVHIVILAIVEGITEFLPISSTGHLILAGHLLGISSTTFTKSFDIAIQLGAIAAILTLYAKTLLKQRELWVRLLVALLPTLVVGFFLYPFIRSSLLDDTTVTVAALFLGGIALWVAETALRNRTTTTTGIFSVKTALGIGAFQALAVVPGVSRAAATIVGGMLLGLPRTRAVEFSFLLAVPTLLAATSLDLLKHGGEFSSGEFTFIALGAAIAWITAVVTVRFFVGFVQKHTLVPFAVYRILLAAIFFFLVG